MYQFILIIHIFACACLVGLVLVQQGKGATIGAAFGSGASQTVFGSRGSGSFLLKVTGIFLAVFFSTSLSLNYLASRAVKHERQVVLPMAPSNVPAQLMPATVTPNSIPATKSAEPVSAPVEKK
ncbi:MAG: preprotein translocase subunit SecG [Gammaproteobacteria bacterium]|nr:preprotein translocase subunit SecG [Gammaproteobacteria bacterium]